MHHTLLYSYGLPDQNDYENNFVSDLEKVKLEKVWEKQNRKPSEIKRYIYIYTQMAQK